MSRLLILDFDGTITQHDTLDTLISLAIAHSAPSTSQSQHSGQTDTNPHPNDDVSTQRSTTDVGPNKHEPTRTKEHFTTVWQTIVQDYITACEAHRASYHPPADQRTSLQEELAFLESWEPIERASVARVSEAGFFRGLGSPSLSGSEGDVEGRALMRLGRSAVRLPASGGLGHGGANGEPVLERGFVELRKGFGEFMHRVGTAGWEVAVASVNWSDDFIRGVVHAGCHGHGGSGTSSEDGWPGRVLANKVRFADGQILGPHELGGEPLVTAGDKLRAMKELLRRRENSEDVQKVVYVGDSTTDLACLVEADLGIAIADSQESKLLKTMERIQLRVPHVGEADAGSRLVWARDFEEVLRSGIMDEL
ncbi:hypothetical protein VTJ04DRAFT_5963 [Mycothermus thermophilus]|uniref:uncharacterized protein n=1 Tax=Humicola insolens TaxID=85995 RepID=UPI00374237B2